MTQQQTEKIIKQNNEPRNRPMLFRDLMHDKCSISNIWGKMEIRLMILGQVAYSFREKINLILLPYKNKLLVN